MSSTPPEKFELDDVLNKRRKVESKETATEFLYLVKDYLQTIQEGLVKLNKRIDTHIETIEKGYLLPPPTKLTERQNCLRKNENYNLLHLCREFQKDSPFYKDNLPLDVFKIIMGYSEVDSCQHNKRKVDVMVIKGDKTHYFCRECFLVGNHTEVDLDKTIVMFLSCSTFVELAMKMFSFVLKPHKGVSPIYSPTLVFFPELNLCLSSFGHQLYNMFSSDYRQAMRVNKDNVITPVDFFVECRMLLDVSNVCVVDPFSDKDGVCELKKTSVYIEKINPVDMCCGCKKDWDVNVIYNSGWRTCFCKDCINDSNNVICARIMSFKVKKEDRFGFDTEHRYEYKLTHTFKKVMKKLYSVIEKRKLSSDYLPYKIFFLGYNYSLCRISDFLKLFKLHKKVYKKEICNMMNNLDRFRRYNPEFFVAEPRVLGC